MIGNGYWAIGIEVAWAYAGCGEYGWYAKVDYRDDGFVDDIAGTDHISTEGELRTRYQVRDTGDGASSLPNVIDVILADASRLGIRFRDDVGGPRIYYKGDGEHADSPPPEGWREMLARESERIGWEPAYRIGQALTVPADNLAHARLRPVSLIADPDAQGPVRGGG